MRRRHEFQYEPPCGPSGQGEQSSGDQEAAEEAESCAQVLVTHVRHLNLHVRRRTRSILAKWAVKRELSEIKCSRFEGTDARNARPGDVTGRAGMSCRDHPDDIRASR